MRALLLAVALLGTAANAQERGWRATATPADRERLREWRTAWVEALAQARANGRGDEVAALGPLLEPDRGLGRALPPAGAYRCRSFALGGERGWNVRPWTRCRIEGGQFGKDDGAYRPEGTLFDESDTRAIFLGTMMVGDEVRPMPYGRDHGRDMAGVVERVGPARWRIVLPYPGFGSTLRVIELVPAQ